MAGPDRMSVCPSKPQQELLGGGGMLCRAPAKLNLRLRVHGRREDGYHEIDSIAAKVTLYDELRFRPREDGRIRLECSGLDCGRLEDNLVYRAARMLAPMAGGAGMDVRLEKHIPAGTGLGGGSSDAAATLLVLNRIWRLRLSEEQLVDLGARIGSDVPLFLDGPAARIRGRGEQVEPMEVHPFLAVLCLPDLSCDTAKVYAVHDEMFGVEPPAPPRQRPAALPARLDGPPSSWTNALFNDLQAAAMRFCPGLEEISAWLAASTRLPVHLTGSGSALFVLADDEPAARRALAAVPADLRGLCRLVGSNPW